MSEQMTLSGVDKVDSVHPPLEESPQESGVRSAHPSLNPQIHTVISKCINRAGATLERGDQGGVDNVHLSTPALMRGWLDDLRERQVKVKIVRDRVRLDGRVTPRDRDILLRFHDVFLLVDEYPDWWAHVLTGEGEVELAPDGCVVLDCDGELEHYSADAIPFCAGHNPDWWLA